MLQRWVSAPPLFRIRKFIWYRGDSVRYIVAEVDAPPGSKPKVEITEPIAIVFDASSSAKRSAVHSALAIVLEFLERLPRRDRVFVVVYSRRGEGVAEAQAAQWGLAAPRFEVKAGLGLVDSWLYGAELVARSMEDKACPHGRVLLLQTSTDSEARAYLSELGQIARGLETRGVVTTAIGVESDVDLPCLIALDECHGQEQIYAETPAEIAQLLATNVLKIYPVVATDVAISIIPPMGVDVSPIDHFDAPWEGRTSIGLGAISAGAKELAIFKLRFPPGNIGECNAIEVQTTWKPVGEGRKRHSSQSVTFEFAPGRVNSPQAFDGRAALLVTQAWRNAILWQAYQLISEGRDDEADRLIKTETLHLERYTRTQYQLRDQLALLAEGLRTLSAA